MDQHKKKTSTAAVTSSYTHTHNQIERSDFSILIQQQQQQRKKERSKTKKNLFDNDEKEEEEEEDDDEVDDDEHGYEMYKQQVLKLSLTRSTEMNRAFYE